jgi:hypothetical protein
MIGFLIASDMLARHLCTSRKEHCEDELKNSTMILNFV